jgi:hypothetical protein
MWKCTKCGVEVADECRMCWICGRSAEEADLQELPQEMFFPAAIEIVHCKKHSRPRHQVGMPRQFGIGTMLVLTTLFALLFGILKTYNAHLIEFVVVSSFVAGILACQALLFRGKNPRLASIVGGVIMYALICAVLLWFYSRSAGHSFFFLAQYEAIFWSVVSSLFVGGPLGYVVGCFVAAIFLVRKEPENAAPPPESI